MLGAMSDRSERSRILGSHLPADLGADAARLQTMLEVAFLAAASDGELADVEIDQLVANLQAWIQTEMDAEKLVALFDDLGDKLASEGAPARLAAAAAVLDPPSRQ